MFPDCDGTLIQLGLTRNQSKIYFSLFQLGTATIKEIGKSSGIPRESVYRTIPTLEKMSLIEKSITNPTTYTAIPVEDAVSTLMKRRNQESHAIQQQANQLIEHFRTRTFKNARSNEDPKFTLVLGQDAFNRQMNISIRKTCYNFEGATTCDGFRKGMLNSERFFIQATRRGVKFRHIVVEKKRVETLGDEKLKRVPLWTVRYFPDRQIKMVVLDNREVFVSITPNMEAEDYLYSTSPCLISMARNYFESMWKKQYMTTEE
jgi:sugar-specific transcriptional regulator TrmB